MRLASNRRDTLGVLALIVVMTCLAAWRAGPDASWDLRNYHLYNPFAALHGKSGVDLAPAQLQSFYPPALDIVYSWLRSGLNNHPVLLDCILSLPQAAAIFLAFLIAASQLPVDMRGRTSIAFASVLLGATGAGSLPTLGTTMSEMVPAALVLSALLLLLRSLGDASDAARRRPYAGLLLGFAAGLKLTAAIYTVGAIIALTACWKADPRSKLAGIALFGLSAIAGTVIVAGHWWLHLYQAYGNPLFPYFNALFRSPFIPFVNIADRRFFPRTVTQALFYPFYWATSARSLVIELPTRDPRFALAYLALLGLAMQALVPRWRPSRETAFLAIFFVASFVLWEAQFSILRYLAPLELLCGVLVLMAARPLFEVQWLMLPAMAGLCVAAILWTVYPDWGRARPAFQATRVQVPELPADSLVILLDRSAMAYVAAFAPSSVPFVGANNNLIQPGGSGILPRRVENAIRSHPGPLWGLEIPDEPGGVADATLGFYGLRRDVDCTKIRSNLDHDAIRLCPLRREAESR